MPIKLEAIIDMTAFLAPEGVALGITPEALQTAIHRSLLELFQFTSRPGTGFAEPFEGSIEVLVKEGH